MDDAERIPIDIGHEVGSPVQPGDPRTTAREDGTVVIDILLPQPCEPDPSTEDEIVVCAVSPDGQAPVQPPPPPPTPMEKLQEALSTKLGPVEIGPGGVDGGAGFSARIRF
jgi:hypothetical protein